MTKELENYIQENEFKPLGSELYECVGGHVWNLDDIEELMKVPSNTETNRVNLATQVIESWDHNDLYNFAHQQLEEIYLDKESFKNDWLETMED